VKLALLCEGGEKALMQYLRAAHDNPHVSGTIAQWMVDSLKAGRWPEKGE
jgi:hypothetical protein